MGAAAHANKAPRSGFQRFLRCNALPRLNWSRGPARREHGQDDAVPELLRLRCSEEPVNRGVHEDQEGWGHQRVLVFGPNNPHATIIGRGKPSSEPEDNGLVSTNSSLP